MAASDSEEEILEDNEYDGDDDPDVDAEDETLDVGADDATEEGDDVRFTNSRHLRLNLTIISCHLLKGFRIGRI